MPMPQEKEGRVCIMYRVSPKYVHRYAF